MAHTRRRRSFVLSHRPAPEISETQTLVTTGIEDAIAAARETAGDKDVALMGGGVLTSALEAGLVDELILHQVPVLLGGGRSFFHELPEHVQPPSAGGHPGTRRDPPPLRGGPMILVTGGLGMIGAHTARALVDLGHEVVVTTHRRTEVPSFLAGRVTVESLDVTDRDAFLALAGRHDISDIVHLAGSIPDEDPVRFFRTDTTGLLNALDAARTWGVRRFAVASSLGVYIGRTETPWHEELALPTAELPHLIIAFKKAVEPLTTHSLQGSGVQPVVLRIGSTWGPLMDPESPFYYIPPYISAVLRGEEPQPLYADDGGDSCYAPDAGRAIALLTTAETLRHDTYNVSSGRPFTNRELADALQAITPGLRLDLLPGRQAGPGDDPYLDTTRLTHDTGFAPAFDIAAAVADYVAWRADNPR